MTTTDHDQHALFATLEDGSVLRLTDWLTFDLAQGFYQALPEDAIRPLTSGAVVTIYAPGCAAAGHLGQVPVRAFGVRSRADRGYGFAPRQGSGEIVVRVWSQRAYKRPEGAVKAWNRLSGSRYVGGPGGWIYRVAGGTRVLQGWADLRETWFTPREGFRYLVSRDAVTRPVTPPHLMTSV